MTFVSLIRKLRLQTRLWCWLTLTCLSVTACGCSQFVLISYLLHGPPSIEPDFDAETGESMSAPKKVVAVVCFAPTELQWKFPQIDDDVAKYLTYRLAEKHIKVIEPDYIRAYCDEHPDWEKASEIGKFFHANYVIEVELADFSLYEGESTTLYRGRTEAYVHVVKMDDEFEEGERIFTKELDFVFPTKVPRSSYDQPLPQFKKEYLSRLSERLGFLFYERYQGDMIPWAD
ncbi:hypothetical protein [Planctomicrobium sp. SH664]|uniref:hypothetical protein n=1 Tax=Planctomicrobium sp. SH664 TaxID=3448125 RepID=UPI003F5B2D33